MSGHKKKLIEVALPLDAINRACKEDKNRKTGTIRNLHKWFAPMPVPALRAIIFSALVNDPESTEDRDELLRFVANLVSSGPEAPASALAEEAQRLIMDSVGPELPVVLDPFCGGGSTLVEAQRLGLPCEGSDLNPVPVLISKVLTQIPQSARGTESLTSSDELGLHGLRGLTEDVRQYAGEVYEKAWSELKGSYPVAPNGDPVIAWWWCRTVASPDPTKHGAHTPIVQNWMLSKEKGRKNFVHPLVDEVSGQLEFEVRTEGEPQESAKRRCVFTDAPYTFDYLKNEGKAGRLGVRLMAIISYGEEGRAYHSPCESHESAGLRGLGSDIEFTPLPSKGLGFRVQPYGFENWEELFTSRQQLALSTFARLVSEVPSWVERDGGTESRGVAIATVLGLCIGRLAHFSSTQTRWKIDSRSSVGKAESGFGRNDLPMLWDFVEVNPFGRSVGDWLRVVETSLSALKFADESAVAAVVRRCDARESGKEIAGKALVVTDPPYFAAIGYADLSDYFYVWIRRALLNIRLVRRICG